MKKIIVFTTLLIFGLVTLVNAQEPISFRSNALGGIINDDLDLIYDPIELRFVGKKYKLIGNGVYDVGEKFTDLGNNSYDIGESFQDQNKNGIYDEGESYEDLGNGIYDIDEPFEDLSITHKDKGIRFYTNLSNLTSSEEQLFADISDDELLIGVSSRNPLLKFLWHSILVRLENSETSNLVGIDSDLDGIENITGNGNIKDEYTAFIDIDDDGSYDLKNMFSQEKSNFTTDDSYTYILNNAIKLWKLTLGVKLSMGTSTNTGNTASSDLGLLKDVLSVVIKDNPTYSQSQTYYLIGDDYNNLTWSEDGNFNSEIKSIYTKVDASFMLALRNIELRANAKISTNQSSSNNINDSYSGQYEYFEPEIAVYNNVYSQTHSYISRIEQNGDLYAYGGSIRKTFNKKDERKNDGFWQVGASVNAGDYKYTDSTSSKFSSIENYFNGLDNLNTAYDETDLRDNTTTDEGTNTTSGLTINSRLNIPLRENIHFGIGCTFVNNTSNLKTDYIESENNIHEYKFTDPNNNDNNYITTATSQLKADKTYEILTSRFIYPIGLEYRIGKNHNLSFRFGAIFTQTSQTIDDTKQITASDPHITKTVFEDVTTLTDVTITENDIYESTNEHTRTTSSSTIFTYGFGYTPIENLQIDLLGFLGTNDNSIFDTSFYRNLRLSFTMKF